MCQEIALLKKHNMIWCDVKFDRGKNGDELLYECQG